MNESRITLEKILLNNISQEEAFSFFDGLKPIEVSMMKGMWRGKELHTGHPMEGLLSVCKWSGKKFVDVENVFPLVFEKGNHKLYYGNPGVMPLNAPYEKIPKIIISILFKIVYPFIKTKKSKARLRMVEFRGKSSASMLYDQVGIIDIFRKVDASTVMGIMDFKQNPSGKSYFFALYKE